MKAIMLMFDSLSRRMLPQYGNQEINAPNFKRLAEKTCVFDNFYAGSLPCMPARRELHTGRYNFLHRSWGPVEIFDDSMPELLKKRGIYSHLVSDHLHYWGDGGSTYHTRYSSWECVRGQVADEWVPKVKMPQVPEHIPTMREFTHKDWWKNYWKNRSEILETQVYPQDMTFEGGLKFLQNNHQEDNWFLHIETFDPHEPFDVEDDYLKEYEKEYNNLFFNSPSYGTVIEDEDVVKHAQALYKALISKCDRNLGKVLDFMDEHDMWKDTMLIINTDHGLFVGEKGWWAKSVMPCYNEIAHLPFAIWDPRVGKTGHRKALAQTIDIAPTILDFFGLEIPKDMQGKSLRPAVEQDTPLREYALYGYAGSFVNITDGKNVYMRASQAEGNRPLNEYTLVTTGRTGFLNRKNVQQAEYGAEFPFTKGCKVLKFPAEGKMGAPIFCNSFQFNNLLWNLEADPNQEHPEKDNEKEAKMINALIEQMKASDAPEEQYTRIGLDKDKTYTVQDLEELMKKREELIADRIGEVKYDEEARKIFVALIGLLTADELVTFKEGLLDTYKSQDIITYENITEYIYNNYSKNKHATDYFIRKLTRVQ